MRTNEFTPSNPWPDPEPDDSEPGKVWRHWLVELVREIPVGFEVDALLVRGVRVQVTTPTSLVVGILSDDPTTCDPHEVMTNTREMLLRIDRTLPIRSIQGVDRDQWLLLR
jgi:hypothetical protein